ncbi:hypothetical protein V6N12_058486 [Hibiscus sabdariffa]|uniref:Uncharacterized protein n=1 Tax=Hibiscus sabdariffa TaxID=183260 RepID=A0ABR2ESB1_9ROSI
MWVRMESGSFFTFPHSSTLICCRVLFGSPCWCFPLCLAELGSCSVVDLVLLLSEVDWHASFFGFGPTPSFLPLVIIDYDIFYTLTHWLSLCIA